ncbi:MAG: hypothetical protein JWL94_1996 [Microbacteriaceae bacterium]|nr:hypothetical protein [Microbacteriaceae bacterium]HEV7957469.1 hypothetical protein [Marisediminicola sp.]
MIIAIPRSLIVALAALFSAYHLVLAAVSIDVPVRTGPYIGAMAIYAVATIASLWPSKRSRMEIWLAAFNVAAAVAMSLLVTSQLPDGAVGSYAAWHTAAVGTLMVITSTKMRQSFAWLGVGILGVQTVAWQGVGGLVLYGVVGSIAWIGISHALAYSLSSAGRDTRQYALAEREAAQWRAAQEAHVFERQFRLGQTSRMSLPMLRQIVVTGGHLTDEQRRECVYLEGAIRDEIRGRELLNDRVREEVMAARRRGVTVTLLDEGGIDDLPQADLDRVLNQLAAAIGDTRGTSTDRIIARTVPHGSPIAVTVVGLSSGAGEPAWPARNSDEDGEDEIDLWLEIPRSVTDAATP